MELSPGTDGNLTHGSHPHGSPTSMAATPATAAKAVDSSNTASEKPSQSLSRSSSLLRQKQSSLPPRAHAGARHTKRLTLNFPINIPLDQPPVAAPDPTVSSPGSMTPATQSSTPALPPGTPMPFDVEDDGYDFLRAIASQERKVLELREELHRAEAELSNLKKQWAQSEKTRKRTEISLHAEPLLPLRSPDLASPEASNVHRREQSMSSVASSSVSQERVSRELERRTSVRVPPVAPPKGTTISANGRRVFQGSHTRTLSLLSPIIAPSPLTAGSSQADGDRVGRTPRSATLPSVERENVSSIGNPMEQSQVPEHVLAQWRKNMPPPSREALMRTGKQMASDLREGLWTFFEDIRQATVGEEGINATESRTMSPSNGSLAPSTTRKRDSLAKSRSRDRLPATGTVSRSSSSSSRGKGIAAEKTTGKDIKPADISTSFWHEFGVDSPAQTSPRPGARSSRSDKTIPATTQQAKTDSGLPDHHFNSLVETDDETADNWDVWDTPLPASKMTHTPSSSRSTVESSKHEQSPTTQGSSRRTSARYHSTFSDFIYDNLVMR